MNANCYRVIFNKTRGMLMVVSEAARSQGKTNNPASTGSDISQVAAGSQTSVTAQSGKLDTLRSHLLLALGLASIVGVSNISHADNTKIIADQAAAKNQQATILNSANGTTQVNIQTPSKAGVSRNVFSQFDVGQDGAILNNSRINTQTQMAGWVDGNPWLARGEAKVILNEVNSSDPSKLNGFTEIAGRRAELVIANPAGITCAGCGFINASRTTLTTGEAMMKEGKLTGFNVKQGQIRVDGTGMNTGDSDYTQLISKTTQINAEIHAKNLDVITGSNQVSYEDNPENTNVANTSGSTTNSQTGVALDVSSLGGMYAGKIRLIGTDKGMGVTNAGSINTSGALSLDANGNLVNSGSLTANQGQVDIDVNNNQINNSGTIASSRNQLNVSSDSLDNSGVISSYDTAKLQQAGSIKNLGKDAEIRAGSFDLTATSLTNTGKLLQTGTGNLSIAATSLVNRDKAIIGQDLYPKSDADPSKPEVIAPTTPPSSANNGSVINNSDDTAADGQTNTPVEPLPTITKDGSIKVDTLSITQSGSVYANGKMDIQSNTVSNTGQSSIGVSSLKLDDNGSAINNDSRIQLDAVNWKLASFDNSKGQIIANGGINIDSNSDIKNAEGSLASAADINLATTKDIDNHSGIIQGTDLNAVSKNFNNSEGNINAQGSINIDSSGNLNNNKGSINSTKDAHINSDMLTNDKGVISSQASLTTHSTSLDNSGQIYAKDQTSITNKDAITNSGTIASAGNTNISAGSLTQTGSGSLVAGMDTEGKLIEGNASNLTVNTTGNLISQGQHIATGNVSLTGADVNLEGSTTQGQGITTKATTGSLNTKNASIAATDTLSLHSEGTLDNTQGNLSGKVLDITASALNNTDGKLTQTGSKDLTLKMLEGINNSRGEIASNSNNLTIVTSDLNNSDGKIVHAGNATTNDNKANKHTLNITASRVNNTKGQVLSLGDQTWKVAGDINNTQGVVQASRFDISAAALDNTDGRIQAVNPVQSQPDTQAQPEDTSSRLNISGDITNSISEADSTGGVIANNTGALDINAKQLVNDNAKISSLGSLSIDSDNLSNSGSVYTEDNLIIANAKHVNNSGSIASQGNTSLNTESFTQNNKGRMIAGLTFEGELSDNNANLRVVSDDKQINSGTNIATGDINLTGSELDLTDSRNQSGNLTLTAKIGDITLDAASTNVSQKASFITTSKLSNDKGVLQAGEFDWQVNELSNVAGSINQTGAKDFTLITTGNINNQQGVIGGTANRLTVHSDEKLTNRTGKIVHNGSGNADIKALSIDNTEGTIISNNALTVKASKNIDNTQGGIQGDALNVQSQSINNDNGKLISLTGDLQLNSDLVTNQGKNAFIQSGKDLKVNSQRLDNKQSATLWAQGNADISATDSLTNLSGATLVSDKQLVVKAGTLTNDAKISSISNEVVLNSDGLNNLSQGQITGATNNVITTRQALNNQGVIGATDNLDINSGATDNLDINSGAINNTQGVLSAAEVKLDSDSDINNDDGLIAQTDKDKTLTVSAKGKLSNQNTKVEADQQNAANQKGILANGSATISAGGLDNQSGHIAADALEINLTSADSINNAQGQIQATKGVNLTAKNSKALNNQGGQILAGTVDLTVGNTDKGRIDNNTADSLIQGGSKVNITTGIVDNQNTKQVGDDKNQGVIAGEALTINSGEVNNQKGQLLANNTININATTKVNNQSGIIQSQNIGISDNSTTSRNLVLNNDSGRIAASQDVALVAKSFSNQGGEILANGRADVNVIDDIRYTGTNSINANEVALTTKGDFINTGVLSGQNALTINASTIDNQKDSELSSQGTTQLTTTSNIDNRGLINGSNTYLKADGSVNNYSHGRIYGDHLAIGANTLNNTPDKFSKVAVDECQAGPGCAVEYVKSQLSPQFITDLLEDEEIDSEIKDILKAPYDDSLTKYYKVSSEPAPVIAARERLDIGVQTLNNNPNQARAGIFNSDFNGQAKILSNGELHIGGSLDANHHAIGKANTVTNKGASIESVGGMRISADTLKNVNADFDYNLLKTDEQQVMDFLAGGKIYTSDEAYIQLGGWNDHWHKILVTPEGDTNYGLWVDDERRSYLQRFYTNKVYTATTVSSDPSLIRSGGNTNLNINKAINDNSIIVDAKTLTLSNYTVGPNSGNVDNQSTMGIELTEKANASAINYNTKGKKRNPLSSKRPYTKKSNIDNYSIPTELAETYELPILKQNIDKTVIAYKDGNISDVESLDSIKAAIEALTQDKQTAVGQSENPSVNKVGTEDALQLLEGFVKADDSKLTDAQKQQLQALLNAQKNGNDIDNAAVQDLIDSLNDTIAQSASEEIRSSNNTPTLPNSSLYAINPDSSADYLIETDPAFADYKKWLSSDYMMQRLKLDPSVTHKRLGDGYYEQQYIRDQIMELRVHDFRINDEQYKELMDAGITAAKTLNLRLGIALTAEQVAQLTTDIVWIEEQTITLDDGSTHKALVPKVYTRQAVGQMDGTGSFIATNNLVVNVTGDVNNQGLLVGRNNAYIKSLNLTNEGGGVIAGDYLQLNTANDLTNKSLIKAGSAANLKVGGNFNNQSDTYSTSSTKGLSSGSRTDISQLATIYVGDTLKGQTDEQGNPLITFNANVGGNTTFDAGVLDNQGGSTRINTAGDTHLNAVNAGYQTNAIGDANNYFKQGETRDIGSQITGTDDITIQSGEMVTGKALQVNTNGGDISLQGKKGVKLTAGHQTDNLSTANTYKEDKWYGDKKISQKFNATSDTAVTSDLKANNITINSEQGDVSLIGGNANAKGRADVTAMNGKVTIESVVDSHTQSSSKSTENFYKETAKQKGLEKETLNQTGVTGSSVYINGQNVAINAAKAQAKDGTLQIGDATLATDDSGNLKLDDNGKPIVLTGSIDNLDLGTIELENREWDEKQKGYKGIAKGLMQVAGAVGGALGITDGITIGKSQGHNTTSTSEEVTTLEGSNVVVGGNTVSAKGTQITATAEDAQAVVLGNNIDLGVATTAATTNDYEQKEVVGGEGMKFTNDSLQLGAIVRTDSKDSTTTTTTDNQGVSINSDNITVLGGMDDGSLTTTAAKFNANSKTGNLLLGSKSTVLDGIENTQTITNENTTDTTRISAEVGHVAVDSVKAAEQVKEATSALAAAKNELRDAKDRADRGELSQNAIKDYEANLAAATLNLANAQVNLGSTLATAAGTSATGGFTAGLEGEHSKTVSTETQSIGTWQGTELNAANTTLVGDGATFKGATGNLGNLNVDNLKSLTLKSGTNTSTNSSSSKTNSQTASINTAGNVSLGASTQNSSSQGSSTTQVNTNLNVDSLSGHADTTIINGGVIDISGANAGSYSTDKLYIETVQNTSESSNKSSGANIGINLSGGAPTGGSLGANKANGNAQSIIAAEQSGIIDRGDKQSFKAGDTTNIGGIIANIQTDSEGNQSIGTLNFTTDTLTTKDITNTATNDQRNLGGSIGVGTGKQGQSINNLGVQIGHTANEFESVTKATIGQGAIVTSDTSTGQDSLAGVNRDPFNTEIIIKDQQTAGLGVDANIDARVFTEAGWTQIADEQKDIGKNTKKVTAITATDALKAPAIIVAITDKGNKNPDSQNKSTIDKIKDNTTKLDNNLNAGMSDDTVELAAKVKMIEEGELTNAIENQGTLNDLNTIITKGTDAQGTKVSLVEGLKNVDSDTVKGTTNVSSQTDTYVNKDSMGDAVKIINHEAAHQNGQGETAAEVMGKIGDAAFKLGTWANSDDIADAKSTITPTQVTNAAKAQQELVADQKEEGDLLEANQEKLETQHKAGDKFEDCPPYQCGPGAYNGEFEELMSVYGKPQPLTRKNVDDVIDALSDKLGFDVEDAILHITGPLLDSPVGATAGMTFKFSKGALTLTSKTGQKIVIKSADEMRDIQRTVRNGGSDVPRFDVNGNICKTVCFTAGTLIHTIHGPKPIETIERGELVWSREEFGDKYDYRPVIATKVTPNVPIYEVKIQHDNGLEETFNTTEEHPFWIDGQGWRKASILEAGMKLLDKQGNATATVISQTKLDETDTVYNFEVQDFSTYHIGELGVWVHNAKCCNVGIPSQHVYKEIGEASNLLRKTEVNGTKIRIASGHGYNRAHASGDVRTTGLSMNDIDDAIINDLTNNVNLSTLPTPPFRNGQKAKDISILIQGHKITYRVVKLPNGELSVNTYFPTP